MNIETIKAKQAELEKLIEQFQAQATVIEIKERTIKLHPGEHYAGAVLDADGNHLHDLILLPQQHGKRMTWSDAKKWAEKVGGELPTFQEQTMIFANCKPHLEGEYHWAYEEYANESFYSIGFNFKDGSNRGYPMFTEIAAVAVRRV